MIEIIVAIILVLFYIYLAFTFFSYTSLLLNVALITALYLLIKKDLKDKDNHKYYIASLLLTAVFLIFSSSGFGEYALKLAERALLSIASVAGLLVYFFAHLSALAYEGFRYLMEKHKK